MFTIKLVFAIVLIAIIDYVQEDTKGSRVRDCILSYPDADQYINMSTIVSKCIVDHSRITDDKLIVLDTGYGESKYFLNINSPATCNYLTIGIGLSSKAERRFLQFYPQCKIFGIEASATAYGDFAQIGKILPFAVGVNAANLTMRVWKDTWFHFITIPVVPLDEVAIKHVGTLTIEFATIDIEGAEFAILEALQYDGRLTKDGLIFCQLDAELHPMFYEEFTNNKSTFQMFWRKFIANSPYLPINAKNYIPPSARHEEHRKVSLVNVHSDYCNKLINLDQYL